MTKGLFVSGSTTPGSLTSRRLRVKDESLPPRGTTTVKPCSRADGMDSPAYIPKSAITTSSGRPEDKKKLRPSTTGLWRSDRGDASPTIKVRFPQRSELAGVEFPRLANVKSVTLTTKPAHKGVDKVTLEERILAGVRWLGVLARGILDG